MKSIFIPIFCMLLLISILPVIGQDTTPDTFSSVDWDYIENKDGITLTKYNGNGSNLVIPGELDGKTVTQLEKELFKDNRELVSVVMPNSIKSTGANVFNGCTALKDVQLSTALTSLNTGLFRYCTSLEHITIPFTVTSLNGFVFSDCIQLKDIILLSVTSIGESAFDNCMMLTDVITSGKLTTVHGRAFRDTPWLDAQTDEFVMIGKDVLIKYNGTETDVEIPYGTTMISSAFEENYKIESVVIPETVKNIGQFAFREAVNLRQVIIPKFVTTIGGNAFNGCRSLTEIELPEGYGFNSLSNGVFRNNTQLASINIPQGVKNLPDVVLANCPSLTDIIIPESVTTIHKNAFLNSTNVHLFVTPGSEGERFAQENDVPYDYSLQSVDNFIIQPNGEGVQIIRYTGKQYDVEIPAAFNDVSVTSIGTAAFQNNKQVKRIILPSTIQTIGDWAFSYMDNLEYVQINGNIKNIGSNVFTGSSSLKEIKLPETLEEIGDDPFDRSAGTVICTMPDSAAADALLSMEYNVMSYDSCSPEEEMLDQWEKFNGFENKTNALCDCSKCTDATGDLDSVSEVASAVVSPDYNIIRVPDGLSKLTADLLPGNLKELVLVIPSSVETIDDQIIDGRTLTIISDSGTAAESFAKANGLKFLVQVNPWLGD